MQFFGFYALFWQTSTMILTLNCIWLSLGLHRARIRDINLLQLLRFIRHDHCAETTVRRWSLIASITWLCFIAGKFKSDKRGIRSCKSEFLTFECAILTLKRYTQTESAKFRTFKLRVLQFYWDCNLRFYCEIFRFKKEVSKLSRCTKYKTIHVKFPPLNKESRLV